MVRNLGVVFPLIHSGQDRKSLVQSDSVKVANFHAEVPVD